MIVNYSISRNVNFCQLDCLSTNLRKTIFGENLLLMRKKILLTIIAATAFFQLPANISNMESMTEIDLSGHIINEGVIIGPSPKVPAWTPRISIEDHVSRGCITGTGNLIHEYDENGNMMKDLNFSIKREQSMLECSAE